jgi:hypothetical protein
MRFEVLMAVTIKVTVLWDVMMCSLVDDYQHLERLAPLISRLEDGGSKFLQNVGKHLADDNVTHTRGK